jgi:hypothetical protein
VHGGFKSAWLFGTFCPERDIGASIVVDEVSTEAMNAHLGVISQAVGSPGVSQKRGADASVLPHHRGDHGQMLHCVAVAHR